MHMNERSRQVFEGITDPAAEEYLEINSTLEGIKRYAENGMNIHLDDEEISGVQLALVKADAWERAK